MNNGGKWQTYCHYGLLSVLLLFSVTLQSAAGGGLSFFGMPGLPAVAFVIGIGMNYGPFVGGVFGLCAGLLLDVYTTPSVGFHVVVMTLLGIGCGLAVNHLLMHNRYARFVLCVCSALTYCSAYCILFKWIMGGHDFSYFYRFSLPTAGVCALVSAVYSLFFKWFRRQLQERI